MDVFTRLNLKNFTFFLILMFVPVASILAQVSVTATGGAASGSYTTLGGAIAAVNAGTHTGVISIDITANTTETATISLVASGSGSASYSAITIAPSGGGARVVTSTLSGNPLIDLNGADNVLIDGLNTGGNTLTLANLGTGTGNTSTIRFINDASNNIIRNCAILGSSLSTTAGVVFFATGVATGNDNDSISNCTISAASATTPMFGIYNNGSTAAGMENSSNYIINNAISNFYNTNALSSGIYLQSGATAWNISGNKLFQTVTRNYTSSTVNNIVSVITGDNYLINGNTIGYSSASATGVYATTASTTHRLTAMNFTFGTGPASLITNNIIASFSMTTTAAVNTVTGNLCGISLNAGNAIISGNTIGATSGTASIVCSSSAALGMVVGINSSSANNVSILNNTFGAFTSTCSSTTLGGSVAGINVSGVANQIIIRGNTIGNVTANNMLAGTSTTVTSATVAMGINAISACISADFSNNIIRNFMSFGSGAGTVRGIFTGTTTNTTYAYRIDSNIISNLSTYSNLASSTSGLTAASGIQYFPGNNGSVSYNSIFNISCLNSTTANNTISTGIAIANALNATISRNIIYDIKNSGIGTATATPAMAAGITIRSGNSNCYVVNNMISLGNGQTTNTTFIGIFANHGSSPNPTDRIYFNTVNIEGTVSSGAQPSFGFHRGNFATGAVNPCVVDIRNNIFNNTRSGGTGKHYAIGNYYGATTVNATGWAMNASNYNVLNTADTAAVGYWTLQRSFKAWKTISLSDSNSYTGVPLTFANNTNNLHLNLGAVATYIESGGQAITGFNTDFDNQARPGPTGSVNGGALAPDLGCDEIDAIPIDFYPPVISYPLLSNHTSTSTRTLSNHFTINDYFNRVDTGTGTRPRLYFKKSTDNNTFGANTSATNGWKWVEASNTSSPYSFTIDYSILNGGSVSINDMIQYFVVAQDIVTPINVGSNPSVGFVGTSVANITTAPTTPNSYLITTALSGTSISVGSGQTYTSLTGTGGLFAAINAGLLAGNTVVSVTSDLSEDGTNQLEVYGIAGYTLTIQSSGASIRAISNSTDLSQAMIRINGASGVTFDGSISGSGQYLRIINTHTVAASGMAAVLFNASSANCTVKNCILESNSQLITQGTLVTGTGNNSITLKGNLFRDAQGTPGTAGVPYAAVYSNNATNRFVVGGTASDANDFVNFTRFGLNLQFAADSVIVKYNNFYQTGNRLISYFSVAIQSNNSHTVSNNNFYKTTGIDSGGFVGVLITGGGTGHTIHNNSIGGSNASRTGAAFTFNTPIATAPFYVTGIFLNVGNSPATSVQGNYFSNIGNIATGTGSHVFAINATSGYLNIGTTSGNVIGGLASASDTIVNGYDNGMINYSGTGIINVENNVIGNVAYYSGGGDRNSGITITGTCQATIKNNTIRDIFCNSSDAGFPTVYSPMGICVTGNLINGSNIEGNNIYNITNTNTGAGNYQSIGLFVQACDITTSIKRNRIYGINVNSTGTGTAGGRAAGIYLGANAAPTVSNNQIAIGSGALNEAFVYGIFSNSTLPSNFYYNSIYLNGNTSAGANNSYCFLRNSTSIINSFNNIFYNGRTTSGTGRMFPVGYSTSTNLATSALNNNLMITNTPSSMVQYLTSNMDFATWKVLLSKDGNSLADTIANIAATNLFVAPSAGNLAIQPGNTECWWSNGFGRQIPSITEDFGSTGANRSLTAAGGSTDIGSDEFTPSTNPPTLYITGNNTNGGTEILTHAGRTIATIVWGNYGTVPSITDANFWSGTWPNDPTNNGTATNATYFNTYLNIETTGGSAYSYDIILNYDDAMLGTVSNKANVLLAKKQNSVAGTWNLFGGLNNTTSNTLRVYGLKSFSEFTGSETATPLGPTALSFNLISSNQTICNGTAPATLIGTTPIGGTSSYTYSWLSSTTDANSGFTAVTGANAINYSPGVLTVSTWFKRAITSGTSDTSAAVAITVDTAISSNTISSHQTICAGTAPAMLTGSMPSGGGSTTYFYQWLISTTDSVSGYTVIPGATASNYSPPVLTDTTWYRRRVRTISCSDTSAAVEIIVIGAITSNVISTSQAICSGTTPNPLTGTSPAGGGSTSYTYQWLRSTTSATTGFSVITGATGVDYSPGQTFANTWYKRVANTTTCTDTSASVATTLIPGISNNNIYSSQVICYNTAPYAINGSTPVGGGGFYVYRWLSSTTSVSSGYSIITGATSGSSYSPGILTTTTWYRRLVNSATSSCPDTSAAVEITIDPPITNNIISSAQTLCAGSTPTALTGSAPTGGGAGSYSYQWLASLSGPSTGFNVIGGATGSNFAPGALSQNVWYRRLVSTTTCTDSSAAILIAITPKINTNNINAPQSVCSGMAPAPLNGSTPLGGNGIFTYQWLASTTSATTGFTAVSGATSLTFAPPALTLNTWYRRVVLSGSCTDTSASIRILVNPVIATNTISSSQSICAGASATALTGSTPTGGSGGYTYRWLVSTTNATSGYTPVTGGITIGLSPGIVSTTSWYRRIVFSSTCFDTSNLVQITVNALPIATISGTSNVCSGATQTYSVPSQAGVNFVWTVSGGTISSGAGTNSITVLWGAAGAGSVGIALNNTSTSCASNASKTISIGNTPDPLASGLTTVCSGVTTSYTTPNTGNNYSWVVSGGNILSGVNSNTISVNWGSGPVGKVTVTETAGSCTDTSSLNVIINLTPSLPIITKNLGILSVTPVAGATYQWFKDGNLLPGATNSSLHASINNGVYTVTVTVSGCSTTSNPFTYISSGINKFSSLSNFNVFPNPTTGKFILSFKLEREILLKISLTDASGRVVLQPEEGRYGGDYLKQFDVSMLAKGVYLILVQTNDGKLVHRFVKE